MQTLATARNGLVLQRLAPPDAPRLHALIQGNRDHLTAHGDYAELVDMSLDALAADLAQAGNAERYGILCENRLIGRIDLIDVDPPRYGLGYWLAEAETGRGCATIAIATIIAHARDRLGATDIYAGVTHGNEKIATVLERNGFRIAARFERYTRYHRALAK